MNFSKTNVNISLSSLKNFKMDSRYIFALILLIIFVLEIVTVQEALSGVWTFENQTLPGNGASKGVRVDFNGYQDIIDHINNAPEFKPSGHMDRNPFGA